MYNLFKEKKELGDRAMKLQVQTALAALILGELCPVPQSLLDKLNPQRFQKKLKAKKPYYSG